MKEGLGVILSGEIFTERGVELRAERIGVNGELVLSKPVHASRDGSGHLLDQIGTCLRSVQRLPYVFRDLNIHRDVTT